jgi:hypothetical protein
VTKGVDVVGKVNKLEVEEAAEDGEESKQIRDGHNYQLRKD